MYSEQFTQLWKCYLWISTQLKRSFDCTFMVNLDAYEKICGILKLFLEKEPQANDSKPQKSAMSVVRALMFAGNQLPFHKSTYPTTKRSKAVCHFVPMWNSRGYAVPPRSLATIRIFLFINNWNWESKKTTTTTTVWWFQVLKYFVLKKWTLKVFMQAA